MPRWGGVLCALGYVVLVCSYTDFWDVYEFDPDEGNNLVKALLVERGYTFPDEIWSDQPPLHTYLLRYTFRLFGWEVAHGRLLTLVFAALTVFAIFESVRRRGGVLPALAGVALLVSSHSFVPLSVAVMIGLPSIAWASLAAWMLVRFHETRRGVWVVGSGVALALSVSTKMFTVIAVPLFLLTAAWWSAGEPGPGRTRRIARVSALYGLALLVTLCVALWPALGSDRWASLYRPHQLGRAVEAPLPILLGSQRVPEFVADDLGLSLLAVIGLLHGLARPHATTTVFGLWYLGAMVALYFHYPVWTHQRLLMTVPASALAGAGLMGLFEATATHRRRLAPLLRVCVVAWVLVVLRLENPHRFQLMQRPSADNLGVLDQLVEAEIRKHLPHTHLIVTARQIYAFRTGVPTPPNLAVTSAKRFFSGLLTAQDIIEELRKHRPEQVVLTARWPAAVREKVRQALLADYRQVYAEPANQEVELYVSRRLLPAGDTRSREP